MRHWAVKIPGPTRGRLWMPRAAIRSGSSSIFDRLRGETARSANWLILESVHDEAVISVNRILTIASRAPRSVK